MTSSAFQNTWRDLARRWGLRVETPFVVELQATTLEVPVLLRDFGGVRGMLLVTEYDPVSRHTDALIELGYGYSCLQEPDSDACSDDEDALMEMLADWGWTGDGEPPAWYRGATP